MMTRKYRKCTCGKVYQTWNGLKKHVKKYNCGDPYQILLDDYYLREIAPLEPAFYPNTSIDNKTARVPMRQIQDTTGRRGSLKRGALT